MSRVLIADDHAVVRAGYKQFLEAEAGITAIGETSSGNETLDQLRRHVTSGYPKVRVLIMSGLPEAQYARNVLRAGAGVGEIAAELGLSVKTVSTYRSRILEKMNFNSNADMTAYALRNGLIL